MLPGTFTHFVFVDFENVPKVDLALVKGKAVHVTLLIGNKQTKLDTGLSLQLHEYARQVDPVQVEASGRNALDMILAGYLGEAVERHKGAEFTVVSRDKDFAPLLGHLRARGIKVAQSDTFAAVFQTAALKPVTAPKIAPAVKKSPVDRLELLIASFKASPQQRPKKRITLVHHIETFYGKKLSAADPEAIVTKLKEKGVISIDDKDKVAYL